MTSLISLAASNFTVLLASKYFLFFDFDALTGQSDLLACTLTIKASPEPGHIDINAKDIDCDIEFEFDLIEEDRNALDVIDAMEMCRNGTEMCRNVWKCAVFYGNTFN